MLAQPSTSGPLAAASSSSCSSPQTLAELDERLATVLGGVLVVQAPREANEALIAHLGRRLRSLGHTTILARAQAGAPLWHEVAARLLLGRLPNEPMACANAIVANALLRRAAIVAPLPREGTWDRAVAVEIAARAGAPRIVFVSDAESAATDVQGEHFDIGPTLGTEAKALWWRAVADEAHALVASDDLGTYEEWWSGVRRASGTLRIQVTELPHEGVALFTRLALIAAPRAIARIEALGPAESRGALASLVAAGAVDVSHGWVAITPAWIERGRLLSESAPPSERTFVAGVLTGDPDPQPWAYARAAELLAYASADAGEIEAADSAHAQALAGAEDPLARREIVARWMDAIDALPAEARRTLLMRSAERALAAGEPDEAMRCAHAAAASASDDAAILLLLGRAYAATGDIVAARAALERARALQCAQDGEEFDAVVTVELAELAFRTGEVSVAREHASFAIAHSQVAATRLKARNTLGKLLLAESKWDEADRHFADDGLLAIAQNDVVSELRARLNRGIALLSKGHFEEANVVFVGVLAEGERRNEPRARAYALINLGVIAMRRHDYGAALGHWSRTIELVHAMRDRIAAAYALAALAEVRHTLGLLDHAEHTLSFGRRILGPAITAGRAARFGIVAARIALTRGRPDDARREIQAAIPLAQSSSERELLGEARCVAARIALEDGDLARASAALDDAKELATKSVVLSELALLRAMLARAAGKDAFETAEAALVMARDSSEEEILREAHVLLGELHAAAGNGNAAASHIDQAMLLCDKIADSLSPEVRTSFLARPEIVRMAALRGRLDSSAIASSGVRDDYASPTKLERARDSAPPLREIVGDDPAVRGLLAAIRKVARSNSTVLIRGESGTGKELIAEALHYGSDRRHGPLVTVNCAALVETLLLSELFGHEKGAFTGAASRRRGRFELAEGGTLFLDEIGDISPRTQVALLRVLQERTFERVGGTSSIHANVRIVCASHRDLRAMVERGEFREDLYYRLRGITLEAPPLRARVGDLPRIAEHLLARIAAERGERPKRLSAEALLLLARHRWPGNVRELENALRTAALFAEGELITACDLGENVEDLRSLLGSGSRPSLPAVNSPPCPASSHPTALDVEDSDTESDGPLPQIEANATAVAYAQVRQGCVTLSDMKRQIERDCIARALAETKGNITRAATLLGMKRPRLSQLVKQYGLAAVSSEA